ncbi:MAG TPA: BrxA family protein [Bacteroidales bacterium]|nr:BrxA family protein [Bacteroidales bacterium]
MKYNTDINIIGSIPDYHLIYKALPLILNTEGNGIVAMEKLLVTDNEFNFRTEESRKRFLRVINSAFVNKNHDINLLGSKVIEQLKNNEGSQALVLFWLFSINNTLFYDLNRDLFLKFYFLGRAELPKSDIIAYLKDIFQNNPELKGNWSEKTIDIVASKYLTVLKRLHLLEGSRKKKYRYIRVSDELLAVFIYFLSLRADRESNILIDEFIPFSFVSKDSLIERLKKLGKKDLIRMNYSGTAVNIEPSFNINNIVNVIFRRA